MTTKIFDNQIRQQIAIQSLPLSPTDWLEVTSPSIPAGADLVIGITTTPENKVLSLWNFLFSIRVDTNTDEFLFPNGAGLSAEQENMKVQQWVDYAGSSDEINQRLHYVIISNNGANAHVYHFLYKSYSFAAAPGTQS